MSNSLAVATVTATLRHILTGFVGMEVGGAEVTMLRPDDPNGAQDPRVNIYLYQVTPSAAWRNADLPTRNADGQLVRRPKVGLDLQYILSFYGNEVELQPQRLLGSVVGTLDTNPVLTRDKIIEAVGDNLFLSGSDLADQVELVKFTPSSFSLEELSKLWSVFFQVPYVLSVAYQASVVLIEWEATPPQRTLPVRERKVHAVPFRQPVIERITSQAGDELPILAGDTLVIHGRRLRGDANTEEVENAAREVANAAAQAVENNPSATPAEVAQAARNAANEIAADDERSAAEKRVADMVATAAENAAEGGATVDGVIGAATATVEVAAAATKVQIGGTLVPPVEVEESRITLPLSSDGSPFPPDLLRAGVKAVQVVHELNLGTPGDPHKGFESNVAAFVLRPSIENTQVADPRPDEEATTAATVTVTLNPQVGQQQRVVLLLNEFQPASPPGRAYRFDAETRTGNTTRVEFQISRVVPGDYLVCVQVDGAESPLDVNANRKSPTFNQYTGTPRINVPDLWL